MRRYLPMIGLVGLFLVIAIAVVPYQSFTPNSLDQLLAHQGADERPGLPRELAGDGCTQLAAPFHYREVVVVDGMPYGEVNTWSCDSAQDSETRGRDAAAAMREKAGAP